MNKQYVAAELEPVLMYPDQTGKFHPTREEAIDANFQDDLNTAILEQCNNIPATSVKAFLERMAENHPDMLRILVGDRGAT